MKAQIRTRKQNVATLETMLLNAKSGSSRRKTREPVKPESEPVVRPSIIKFFVTGPDGSCVEFNERGDTFVSDVIHRVRDAFQSHQPRNHRQSSRRQEAATSSIISCKLIYQGRIMLDDRTLDQENVRAGDTIVAVVKFHEEPMEVQPLQIQPQVNTGLPDLNEFLGKQQETLRDVAVEMRYHNCPCFIRAFSCMLLL